MPWSSIPKNEGAEWIQMSMIKLQRLLKAENATSLVFVIKLSFCLLYILFRDFNLGNSEKKKKMKIKEQLIPAVKVIWSPPSIFPVLVISPVRSNPGLFLFLCWISLIQINYLHFWNLVVSTDNKLLTSMLTTKMWTCVCGSAFETSKLKKPTKL